MNALTPVKAGEIIEAVIARGDIAQLTADERAKYYVRVCESVGLNPMTRPFEYITLNSKLTLYARKDCTDQLRTIHNVSVTDLLESERDGVFVVTAKVVNGRGRADAAKGAVSIKGLQGENLANALMKAETKAKRRATLSICGLGFLDETEIDDIPVGNGRAQTLPKKDARDIYTKMQREVNESPNRKALVDWGVANAERIKILPEDWQDILHLRIQEMMIDLQQREAKIQPTPPEPPAIAGPKVDVAAERDRNINEEMMDCYQRNADPPEPPPNKITEKAPGTDALGGKPESDAIPPGLRRAKGPPPLKLDAWLATLKKECEDKTPAQLIDLRATMIEPLKERLGHEGYNKAGDVMGAAMEVAQKKYAPAKPAFDPDQWYRDLEGAISGCTTIEQIIEVQKKVQQPALEFVSREHYAKGKTLVKAALIQLSNED